MADIGKDHNYGIFIRIYERNIMTYLYRKLYGSILSGRGLSNSKALKVEKHLYTEAKIKI